MSVPGLVEGKVALVSGIGPGMGRDISLLLAEHGAKLALGARTLTKCEEVAKEIEAAGGEALPLTLDITEAASCRAAVDATVERFGGIDILVNNAFHDGDFKYFLKADFDSWRQTMDVNLWGTLQLTQLVAARMKEQGGGRIVMTNSMSAVRVQERYGAYAASKSALATATKTLAMELGRFGIRVNGVHPGYIWGDSVEKYFEYQAEARGITPEEVYAEVAEENALKYLPHSSEIAGAVLFLASDLAKPITGQALHVNAGHWFEGF
ncbi:MAG TPA: SDR family oxidoreductase [Acidimicrobiales bacterium]|nr:SDR family oxidoreductase [Acidimicrobiales bacterium]